MTTVHNLANTEIVSHAFNGDGTQIAVSLYTSELYILKVPSSSGQKFQLIDTLKRHSTSITEVDWAPKTNQIVSCSVDRLAFVWTRNADGHWVPAFVSLALNLAAVCVKWSPHEDMFAAGSSCKALTVCSFDSEVNFWAGKRIKKQFKSTVTCLDWHPNNTVLACGSSDFHTRVYAASNAPAVKQTAWGDTSTFGKLLFDHYEQEGGWVLAVAFSLDGNRLAWTKQNSLVFVADVAASGSSGVRNGPACVWCLRSEFLPFTTCLWVAPSTFVAAGHDCCPMVFRFTNDSGIEFVHRLDVESENKTTNKLTAMRKFQDIDRMATTEAGGQLSTLHQNCINDMRVFKRDQSSVSCITTVGRDGALVFWNLPSLCDKISKLSIS